MSIIETNKKKVQPRLVVNGCVRFVGRIFCCTHVADTTRVLIAYDSQRDTVVELFAEDTGESLGLAHVLEVVHG